MKQYEIWWAKLPPPAGRRPLLLLSRDAAYEYLHKFLVAEITTTIRGIAQEVRLGSREGMRKPCAANFDNIRTVDREALLERAGALPPRRYSEVKQAVGHALGWGELIQIPSPGSSA